MAAILIEWAVALVIDTLQEPPLHLVLGIWKLRLKWSLRSVMTDGKCYRVNYRLDHLICRLGVCMASFIIDELVYKPFHCAVARRCMDDGSHTGHGQYRVNAPWPWPAALPFYFFVYIFSQQTIDLVGRYLWTNWNWCSLYKCYMFTKY
jgi:hypothetical protein